ncbi:MAG TPA: ABC transporter ATP-binding protein [Pseudothermotoga sp.]|nr:ABC transporter ATP-binding protein [Pseudothermotoga sp.]HPP69323.1 ABC transporter ATP-binding protein [Pseudothermotoga sp.]
MTHMRVNDLRAYYTVEQNGLPKNIRAVDGVSFEIEEHDFLAIVGESGCGKTTLAKVLYGALDPVLSIVSGSVHYAFDDSEFEISPVQNTLPKAWWKKISYIPQGSLSALNPIRKVGQIFRDLLSSHNVPFEIKDVENHLKLVNLSEQVLGMYPFELSGGMKQRVVMALATFLNPRMIIADEPTSALDVVTQRDILWLLSFLHLSKQISFVFITHDISLIPGLASSVAVMYCGCIVEYGPVDEVFSKPLHPYTKFLLSSIPRIGDKTEKKPIPGAVVSLINPPSGCRFHSRCPNKTDTCENSRPNMIKVGSGRHEVACWLYK